eukprot:SAG11_NODE_18704_length_483_cov_1.333333_1_plen_27_part_10
MDLQAFGLHTFVSTFLPFQGTMHSRST